MLENYATGGDRVKFDDLFEQRSLVGAKLKDCIRDRGYTKISFARHSGISSLTLDELLNGSIDNKSSFVKHLQKALTLLNMTGEELIVYHSSAKKPATVVYPQNAPYDHEMSDIARRQYDLLLDLIDLCAIYYPESVQT